MKIVRTVKSIVTSSIKRSLTIALVKIILATGLVSLITNYAFGQTSNLSSSPEPFVKILNSSISTTSPTRIQIMVTDSDTPISLSVKKVILKTQTSRIKINGSSIYSTDLKGLSVGEEVEIEVHYRQSNKVGKFQVNSKVLLV
jgi:hypothetical protein